MTKRSFGALAAVVLVAASCGGDDASSTPVETSSAGTAAADVTTADSTQSDDGGAAAGGTATVGAILSETGIYSTLGPPERQAIDMGLAALNVDGFEVDGQTYTMEVTYADDKSDAATSGVTAWRQMVEADEVPVIAFGLGSSLYAPLLERTPLPMINILDSTYPSVLDYNDNIFLIRGASPTYVPGCVNYAKEVLGVTKMAVITSVGEPYGDGLTQLVQQAAEQQGVEVTGVAEYPIGATDYGNAINEAVSGAPEAIYLSSVTSVILPVLKQLRQNGYTGPVFHSSGVNPDQAEAILGSDFNTIMADNYDCAGTLPTTSDNAATKQFAEDYSSKYDEYPQDLTMWAYDFPFIAAAAMTKAGSTTDRAAITKALLELEVPEGTVSGWVPGDNGLMFTDRDARTPSEITVWCSDKTTIASAMVFNVDADGNVIDIQLRDDACAAA
ncbi:MAG: ABC transporter substrate-binding protein [Ilumatobacteraceae bacterium]